MSNADLRLKMRTVNALYQCGAGIKADHILIEDKEGWRVLTDKEEQEVSAALITLQKQDAKTTVAELADTVRAQLSHYANQYKLSGWSDKSQRAQRMLTETATDDDIAILQAECDARLKQETPEQLAQKQAEKAQALAKSVAVIDGMESATLDDIDSKQKASTLQTLLDNFQAQITALLKITEGT